MCPHSATRTAAPEPASFSTRVLSALPPTVWPRSIWIRSGARQRQRHPGHAGIVRFLELDLRVISKVREPCRGQRTPRIAIRRRRHCCPGIPAGSSPHPSAVMARIASDAHLRPVRSLSRWSPRVRGSSSRPAPTNATPRRRRRSKYLPRPINRSASREKTTDPATGDLDAIVDRGYLRDPGRAKPHAFRNR